MFIQAPNNLPIISALDFDSEVIWFRKFLKNNNIQVVKGSDFDKSLDLTVDVSKAFRKEITFDKSEDLTQVMRVANSMIFLIRSINRCLSIDNHNWIIDRLNLFKGTSILFASKQSQSLVRDFAWELLVASLLAPFCRNINFDEPDIIFDYDNTKYSAACKVIYSTKVNTQMDSIIKGAKQIEDSKSDYGIVFVNITNLLTHDQYMWKDSEKDDYYYSFRNPAHPMLLLENEVKTIITNLDTETFRSRLMNDAKKGLERTKTRAIVFFAHTIAGIGAASASLAMTNMYMFRNILGPEHNLGVLFNHHGQLAIHHVLNASLLK